LPKTNALDRAATGTGTDKNNINVKYINNARAHKYASESASPIVDGR